MTATRGATPPDLRVPELPTQHRLVAQEAVGSSDRREPVSPSAFPPRGFYAVLDRADETLARTLVGVGGARILQVRIKPATPSEILQIARMARRVCDEVGAALVIDDRVDLALAVGADGVHLGQTDLSIEAAREIAGDRLVIGVSTHDVEQVAVAVSRGADYLGFGPIFATRTKRDPDPVQGLAGLRAAVRAARGTPIVAIGGITVADARAVYAAGAAAICAIAAVNDAPDIAAAARGMRHNTPWLRGRPYTVLRLRRAMLHDTTRARSGE